jgi:hypothetical protein
MLVSQAMQSGKFDAQNYRAARLNGTEFSAQDLVPKQGRSDWLFDSIKRYYNVVTIFDAKMVLENMAIYSAKV